jgi:hypothetical protein
MESVSALIRLRVFPYQLTAVVIMGLGARVMRGYGTRLN